MHPGHGDVLVGQGDLRGGHDVAERLESPALADADVGGAGDGDAVVHDEVHAGTPVMPLDFDETGGRVGLADFDESGLGDEAPVAARRDCADVLDDVTSQRVPLAGLGGVEADGPLGGRRRDARGVAVPRRIDVGSPAVRLSAVLGSRVDARPGHVALGYEAAVPRELVCDRPSEAVHAVLLGVASGACVVSLVGLAEI